MSQPAKKTVPPQPATAEDLLALPDDGRFEVVNGEIVPRAEPGFPHGEAQGGVIASLRPPFHRRSGDDPPGGWWLATEVRVELARHEVYLPDVVGWRRDRVPEKPTENPVRIRPDWVCEILSPSNTLHDLVFKHRAYHRAGVPHYWIIDPERGTLLVYRWQEEGYLAVLLAAGNETVRAEPFAAIEIALGVIFGAA